LAIKDRNTLPKEGRQEGRQHSLATTLNYKNRTTFNFKAF